MRTETPRLRRRTWRAVIALLCAGRSVLQVAEQVGLPAPVVRAVGRAAGWPYRPAMREQIALADQATAERRPWSAGQVAVIQLGKRADLDDLVREAAASRDPRVIHAIADLEAAAARLNQVAVRSAMNDRAAAAG